MSQQCKEQIAALVSVLTVGVVFHIAVAVNVALVHSPVDIYVCMFVCLEEGKY